MLSSQPLRVKCHTCPWEDCVLKLPEISRLVIFPRAAHQYLRSSSAPYSPSTTLTRPAGSFRTFFLKIVFSLFNPVPPSVGTSGPSLHKFGPTLSLLAPHT